MSGTAYWSYPILPFGNVTFTFFSDNLSRRSCIRPRLLWVKLYANEEKCKQWRQQRFAYWTVCRGDTKSYPCSVNIASRKRRSSRINLNLESFETSICTINCGQVKRTFSKKGYARTGHARPAFARNQAERREIDNNTSEHSPIIKTCYQICLFDDLLWMLKTMWKC